MLEQLLNLVKGESQDAIVNNPAIPNAQNNEAVGMATQSIFSGLQGALAGGGLQSVMSMFGGQSGTGMSNPLVGGIANGLVDNLMAKFGMTGTAAQSIAHSLVPSVMSKLVSQTQDPNNKSIDMNGVLHSLTGGATQQATAGGFDFNNLLSQVTGGGGIASLLGGLTGGGAAAGQPAQAAAGQPAQGGGMQDILSMITNAAGGQQQQGGGVMDLLKKFL